VLRQRQSGQTQLPLPKFAI